MSQEIAAALCAQQAQLKQVLAALDGLTGAADGAAGKIELAACQLQFAIDLLDEAQMPDA